MDSLNIEINENNIKIIEEKIKQFRISKNYKICKTCGKSEETVKFQINQKDLKI